MRGAFVGLAFVLCVVCLNGALAADCGAVTASFTVSPQICKVAYNVPSTQQNNNTGGDALATLFNSFTTLPSQPCAHAYSAYYCSSFYPQCDSSNSTKVVCKSTCSAVVSACGSDAAKFAASALPLPTPTDCNALSEDTATCSAPPQINLGAYYTDCDYYNISKFDEGAPLQWRSSYVMCTPNHTVPVENVSYPVGWALWETLRGMGEVSDKIYGCLKPFANFNCYKAFPECPASGLVKDILPVCKAACKKVQTECAAFAGDFSPNLLGIPSDTLCDSYPETNCVNPTNFETDLSFYFGADPPNPSVNVSTTAVGYTTRAPFDGSYASGGGIGAGVLAGLLFIIGILMLIMKKQDSR